ncbi:MAG: hypothetical protein IIY00_06365 [Clostridia bacterium]|nr:hypothetical protein [Clostridia bacterium]
MKRTIELLLTLLLSFGLFGCEQTRFRSDDPFCLYEEVEASSFLNEDFAAKLTEQGWESSTAAVATAPLGVVFDTQDGSYDARSSSIADMKLTEEQLDGLTYDTHTYFDRTIYDVFDPKAEMEKGKDPGLGIRRLHEEGITGKGVNIAIVDQPLHDHIEYEGKVRYYRNFSTWTTASMHGCAVTSLAVGETIGTAPDAQLYYVAADMEKGDDGDYEAIHHLLDLNEMLPEEDKIAVISLSYGGLEGPKWEEVLVRAESQGVWLLTCGNLLPTYFGAGAPVGTDPQDPLAYTFANWVGEPWRVDVLVPMDNRTIAAPGSGSAYTYMSNGGLSWVPPYLAGVYALAKQVDPDLTHDEFTAFALETAYDSSIQWEKPKNDPYNTKKMGILNPTGIIDALRK